MIAIIGGGVAGLIAAINLEDSGVECTIFEKSTSLGGRVNTDIVEGLPLDRGFQVLLTDYPYAQKYLDYSKLDLEYFNPGAVIFKNGKRSLFGDPLRDLSSFFPTVFSWVGNFSDKIKVYQLSRDLSNKPVKAIFESEEKTTLDYLKNYGFSEKIISNFFKPFFGGIFLESELHTSSRMFEFVFKMFTGGSAAIPKKGMKEIPQQLRACLKKTKIVLGKEVFINDNGTISVDGREQEVKGIIKAYAEEVEWKGCSTLYYKVDKRILEGKIIGLLADSDSSINSFHYLNDNVLSVTCLYDNGDLQTEKVSEELHQKLEIQTVELIKRYDIPRSLPKVNHAEEKDFTQVSKIAEVPVVLAGDQLFYGSLNAAMHSGEIAAQAIIDEVYS
jgi:hypothetical protein